MARKSNSTLRQQRNRIADVRHAHLNRSSRGAKDYARLVALTTSTEDIARSIKMGA